MAKHFQSIGQFSYGQAAAATLYIGPAGGAGPVSLLGTSEATMRTTHRGANVTLRKYRVYATANARTTASTFTWMKGGVAQSMAVSMAGGATGAFEDTTNSVSLTAGDTVSIRGVFGAEAGALSVAPVGRVEVETTSAASPLCMQTTGSTGQGGLATFNTRFGFFGSVTANDYPQHDWQVAGTFSGLHGTATTNNRSDATTVALFKNGASAISVSVAAATTGRFENTANSTTLAVNDATQIRVTTGAGTGAIAAIQLGSFFTPTTAGESPLFSGTQSTSPSSGAVLYFGHTAASSTEALVQALATFNAVASRMSFRSTVNTTTTASTGVSRVNGVNGNQSVSITAGTTGQFVDTTNTDSVATGDFYSVRLTYGSMPDNTTRISADPGKLAEVTTQTHDLTANASAAASATAALDVTKNLAAAAVAQAAATAGLSLSVPLAASAQALSSATGALAITKALAGSAQALAAASANMSHSVPLQAAASALASATAGLSLAVSLSAAAVAHSSASGALTVTNALAASASSSASASAFLNVDKNLSAAAAAQAAGTASLTVLGDFAGAAQSLASATAGLDVTKNLLAAAQALASAAASLDTTTTAALSANASAQASASGVLTDFWTRVASTSADWDSVDEDSATWAAVAPPSVTWH
jgi:hypothetical protein